MPKKIDYQKLEKKLIKQKKSCWEVWDDKTKKEAFAFAEDYKNFLNEAKTERECVKMGVERAEKSGFKDIGMVKNLKAGDKVYFIQKNKSLIMARIGRKFFDNGFKMIIAHIDSPHLDLKVNPLYEDENVAFLKTHYYGGIKKYQWPTIALALHGIIYLANGQMREIKIGEKDNEPVFMITDLLPHLDRPGGPGSEVKRREVKGEDLNLVVGSLPVKNEKVKEKVKLAILEYLFNKYGLVEEDFASAEIMAVPSEKARDLGFDRSLISGYGQDDRVCGYAAGRGFWESKIRNQTQVCVWVDREETGSEGTTGAQSLFFENCLSRLLKLSGTKYDFTETKEIFSKSQAISADATAGLDPDYRDVYDLRTAIRLGYGLAIEKYTGVGGKYYTSEAPAYLIQKLRSLYSRNKDIVYQTGGGLGKVDQGGGGTIAKYLANRDIDVVDVGIPLFNLHAPLEIASKADLYCAYLGYKAFLES